MSFNLKKIGNKIYEKGDLVSLYTYKFKNGKGFPKSYKEFVENYGYGLTGESFIVYIPMGNYGDSFHIQNPIFKEGFLDVLTWGDPEELNEDILYPDGSLELLKRAEPFAKSVDGEYLFWDIESENEEGEFDIYITDFRGLGFTKVAENLYQFFDRITSKSDFKSIIPFNEFPLSPTFKPFSKVG
ncbi:SMI1/KNR4 family protein [Zobellia sp. 1_MG-2023]|uniref:SMI1/KNR4 family protein n=1 Tax=Zobellia sp. 1_MG-2023 TaxID=3062626 RepID=UPI0026E1B5E2|nr:SMI1/KNR4 family protein [Zobellia sp. 1_MG-2023]MDO6819041.1 SMI1/KNR4 family protein [Zobellia sp. 1_MG-2023]